MQDNTFAHFTLLYNFPFLLHFLNFFALALETVHLLVPLKA